MKNNEVTKDNITLIDVNRVGGSTAFLVGGSSSGKTSLLVTALSNIIEQHPDRYDVIMVFSESISAEPLKKWLDAIEGTSSKVHFFPVFIPELVTMMVDINKATDNRYGVLVVLDDCLEGLRGKTASKMINIYRNSGISTIISIQYCKFVTPAMRSSFHRVWITSGRNAEIRKSIIDMFIKGHLRDMGHKNAVEMDKALREMTKMNDSDRSVILLDQIKDELSTHTIFK
jgi:hypothetical protein